MVLMYIFTKTKFNKVTCKKRLQFKSTFNENNFISGVEIILQLVVKCV